MVVIGDSAGLVPNAATSGHDTCVFSLGFLAELLFDFAGTFTGRSMRVRSCEISIFRAILSLQIFIFVILGWGSTVVRGSPSSKKLIMENPEI